MLLQSAFVYHRSVHGETRTSSQLCIRGTHQFSHSVWNCSSCWAAQNFVDPPAALQQTPHTQRYVASGIAPYTEFQQMGILIWGRVDAKASRPLVKSEQMQGHLPLRGHPCNPILIRHGCRPSMQQGTRRVIPLRPRQHRRGHGWRMQRASTCAASPPPGSQPWEAAQSL